MTGETNSVALQGDWILSVNLDMVLGSYLADWTTEKAITVPIYPIEPRKRQLQFLFGRRNHGKSNYNSYLPDGTMEKAITIVTWSMETRKI